MQKDLFKIAVMQEQSFGRDFEKNTINLRAYEKTLANKALEDYEENKIAVQQCVESIAQQIKERKVR